MYGGATGEVGFAALTWGSRAPGECDVMQLGRIDVIPGKQSEFIHQDSELIHGDILQASAGMRRFSRVSSSR